MMYTVMIFYSPSFLFWLSPYPENPFLTSHTIAVPAFKYDHWILQWPSVIYILTTGHLSSLLAWGKHFKTY